ncbi:MAG: hypothetical protein ACJ72N_19865 [Labedaea sp.]
MQRSTSVRSALAGLSLAAAIAAAGCGTSSPPPPPPPPAAAATATVSPSTNPNQIECSNVERAYNAWRWTPSSSLDFTEFNVRRLMESGDDFRKAVAGYKDKPALALALAISQYNYDMSLVNASYAASGNASSGMTKRVVDGVGKIDGSYTSFRFENCR